MALLDHDMVIGLLHSPKTGSNHARGFFLCGKLSPGELSNYGSFLLGLITCRFERTPWSMLEICFDCAIDSRLMTERIDQVTDPRTLIV